jgi:hypothetical protein
VGAGGERVATAVVATGTVLSAGWVTVAMVVVVGATVVRVVEVGEAPVVAGVFADEAHAVSSPSGSTSTASFITRHATSFGGWP